MRILDQKILDDCRQINVEQLISFLEQKGWKINIIDREAHKDNFRIRLPHDASWQNYDVAIFYALEDVALYENKEMSDVLDEIKKSISFQSSMKHIKRTLATGKISPTFITYVTVSEQPWTLHFKSVSK